MKEKPHPDMSFEMEARASGFLCVAGVDEAGRGPLAGPVVAGAVILPVLAEELTGLNDSKQLTAAKRERLFLALLECEQAVCSVGVASVEEIDRFNILRATHLAMGACGGRSGPACRFLPGGWIACQGASCAAPRHCKGGRQEPFHSRRQRSGQGDEGPHDDGSGRFLPAVWFCKTQRIWHKSPHGSSAAAWALSAPSPLVCAGFTNGTVHP